MNSSISHLWTLGCSGNWQQGIQAAKDLLEFEEIERENTLTQVAMSSREAEELKSSSKADTILLKRIAILHHHLNIETLAKSEYFKRKQAMQRKYVGDPLEDANSRMRSIELELSQGLPRKSKVESAFLDQILLSNNRSAVTAAKNIKVEDADFLLLQRISSDVAIAMENISYLQPKVESQAKAFSKKLKSGLYDREMLLNEICEAPFCYRSFKDFAHQTLGLSITEEEIKLIRDREYSHLDQGSWPYLPLSGHDVLNAIKKIRPAKDDVLTEVGCGLGINATLVGLTTGMRVDGFDINPDWVKLANKISSDIGRADNNFYVQDACSASYEDTTIFLIFSPFSEQSLIEEMLKPVESCAKQRAITIIAAYDDLINVLDEASWVKPAGTVGTIALFKN